MAQLSQHFHDAWNFLGRVVRHRQMVLFVLAPVLGALAAGAAIAFRDLVTGENVKLRGGTYLVEECSRAEVEVRQLQWLEHPTRVPVRADAPGLTPEDQKPGPPAAPG